MTMESTDLSWLFQIMKSLEIFAEIGDNYPDDRPTYNFNLMHLAVVSPFSIVRGR